MKIKQGVCPECRTLHEFTITGNIRTCGILCSLGVAAGLKRGDAAVVGLLLSILFGDMVEQWIEARCPECGVALRVVSLAKSLTT